MESLNRYLGLTKGVSFQLNTIYCDNCQDMKLRTPAPKFHSCSRDSDRLLWLCERHIVAHHLLDQDPFE